MSGETRDRNQDADAREFAQRVGAMLSESADALDGRTRSALTRARFAALEVAGPAPSALWRGWAPAGAVAMALLVVVFIAGQRPAGDVVSPAPSNSVDDLALVSDADAFELSNDGDMDLDSEFYEWAAASGRSSGNGLGT